MPSSVSYPVYSKLQVSGSIFGPPTTGSFSASIVTNLAAFYGGHSAYTYLKGLAVHYGQTFRLLPLSDALTMPVMLTLHLLPSSFGSLRVTAVWEAGVDRGNGPTVASASYGRTGPPTGGGPGMVEPITTTRGGHGRANTSMSLIVPLRLEFTGAGTPRSTRIAGGAGPVAAPTGSDASLWKGCSGGTGVPVTTSLATVSPDSITPLTAGSVTRLPGVRGRTGVGPDKVGVAPGAGSHEMQPQLVHTVGEPAGNTRTARRTRGGVIRPSFRSTPTLPSWTWASGILGAVI